MFASNFKMMLSVTLGGVHYAGCRKMIELKVTDKSILHFYAIFSSLIFSKRFVRFRWGLG
jgi:hypothetical protein